MAIRAARALRYQRVEFVNLIDTAYEKGVSHFVVNLPGGESNYTEYFAAEL